MTYTSESGHYYAKDGTPAYTVIGANGKERGTTIRDARKHGYLPSVSGIIKLAAAPGLERWKLNQAMDACLTLPRLEGETLDAFKLRALDDSREQAKKAAEAGTALHGSLESALLGRPIPEAHLRHWEAVRAALEAHGLPSQYSAEKSFASPLGYGGKVDLHCPLAVGDFKSKPSIEDGKDYAYDEHIMQLAAYSNGLGYPQAKHFNLFVGLEDAKVSVRIWEPDEVERGFQMFLALLKFWQLKNNYQS